ncbi:recombinase family protein, partial [Pectobacterium atrosepticum]
NALATMLGRLEFKKAVTSDKSAYLEKKQLEKRIANLNITLQEVDEVPSSVIKTISTMEARVKEITEQQAKVEREQRGIDAVNNAKLSSITDSLELNLMLKRVLKSITVTRSGSSWAVRIFHLSGHTQSFMLDNGKLKFVSDSIALKNLLNEYLKDD